MFNRKFALLMGIGVLLVGLGASNAFAGEVTDHGVDYFLSYALVGTLGSTQTFDVTLTADTTGYTGNSTDLLIAVAIKPDSSESSVSLIERPTTYYSYAAGGTNSGGCDGHGSGFLCATTNVHGEPFPVSPASVGVDTDGGTFSWVWQLTVASGTLFTGANQAGIKAVYYDAAGRHFAGVQTSVDDTDSQSTVTPEPTAMVLAGTFLIAASLALGRKLKT